MFRGKRHLEPTSKGGAGGDWEAAGGGSSRKEVQRWLTEGKREGSYVLFWNKS